MGKLVFNSFDGIGLECDDIDFMQQSLRDMWVALWTSISGSKSDSTIVSGCFIAGGNCSAGWIFMDGEMLQVPAHVIPVIVNPGDVNFFILDISNAPNSTEVTEQGATTEQYEVRTASIKAGPPPADYMPMDAKRFMYRIAEKVDESLAAIQVANHVWKPVQAGVVAGEPYFMAGYSTAGANPLEYMIDGMGNIHFRGRLVVGGGATFQIINLNNAALSPLKTIVKTGWRITPAVDSHGIFVAPGFITFLDASYIPANGSNINLDWSYRAV